MLLGGITVPRDPTLLQPEMSGLEKGLKPRVGAPGETRRRARACPPSDGCLDKGESKEPERGGIFSVLPPGPEKLRLRLQIPL